MSSRLFQSSGARFSVLICMGAVLLLMLDQSTAAGGGKGKKSSNGRVDVLFSPGGGCAARIIDEIEGARDSICVQAYIFTSRRISDALADAKNRGIDVQVVLDKSQEKARYGRWRGLRSAGIPVYFDAQHATANNKVILIDESTIITGSYNFTNAAEEKNAENVLFIRGHSKLFNKYLDNFEKHRDHARRYTG